MGWLGTTVISWGGKIRSCSLSSHRHFCHQHHAHHQKNWSSDITILSRYVTISDDLLAPWPRFEVIPRSASLPLFLLSNSKHYHDHHHCTTGSSCLCFISIPTQHVRWRRAKPRVPALRRQSPPSSRARQPSAFQPPPPGSWSITPCPVLSVLSCLSCLCKDVGGYLTR